MDFDERALMADTRKIQINPQVNGQHVVIEYGARLDSNSEKWVDQEILRARALYNDLVAEMRAIYEEMQAFVLEKAGPDAQAIAQRIEAATEAFQAAKATSDEPTMQRIAQARRGLWKDLSDALKVVRTEYKNELTERFYSRIGNNSRTRTYQIRCNAVRDGLGGSTATAILNNALIAWKKSMQRGKPPRFSVGAEQVQDSLTIQFNMKGGLEVEKVFAGQNASLVIEMPSKGFVPRSYTPFRFRLGAAKAEIYAEGTVQTHRTIPAGAHVALARLVRRRTGPKYHYALQLSVNLLEPIRQAAPARRAALVAVHIGWSADKTGRRVAGISGDGETASILQLPASVEVDLERARAIQSERDTRRDVIIARIKTDLLVVHAFLEGDALGLFWTKFRKLSAQHVSANRLHYLAQLLREREILPDWLEEWRKWDRLQWQASACIARRARNRRMWFYRNEAKKLAEQYESILIDHPDIKKVAKNLNEITGEKTDLSRKARSGRVVAATSLFEDAIRWAACRYGLAVLEMQGERTASQCFVCGSTHLEVDKEDSQSLLCLDCGEILDRKRNGAILAYRKGRESLESLVTDYWQTVLKQRNSLSARKEDRLQKMIAGRKAVREARMSKLRDGA